MPGALTAEVSCRRRVGTAGRSATPICGDAPARASAHGAASLRRRLPRCGRGRRSDCWPGSPPAAARATSPTCCRRRPPEPPRREGAGNGAMSGFGYRDGEPARRGRAAGRDRGRGRHALLRLRGGGDARRGCARFRDAFAGERGAVLLRGQGQQQSRRDPPVRRRGAGCRHGLGRRDRPGAGGRRAAASGSSMPGSPRPTTRSGWRSATGILQFNVESAPELRRIAELARGHGRHGAGGAADQSRRRRPAPTTRSAPAASDDKFGIPYDEAPRSTAGGAARRASSRSGVHLHIGSQITRLEPFEAAYRRGVELFTSLRAAGHPAAPARPRRRLRRALPRRAARSTPQALGGAGPPRDRRAGLRAAVRARPRSGRRGGCPAGAR